MIRLTKLGLLKQIRVKRDQPHWSSDEEGKRTGLKITNAGSRAIGVSDDHKGEEENGACLLGVSFSDWTVGTKRALM